MLFSFPRNIFAVDGHMMREIDFVNLGPGRHVMHDNCCTRELKLNVKTYSPWMNLISTPPKARMSIANQQS